MEIPIQQTKKLVVRKVTEFISPRVSSAKRQGDTPVLKRVAVHKQGCDDGMLHAGPLLHTTSGHTVVEPS